MIDIQKTKIGDKVFALNFETIYEPDDEWYGIYLPVGVKSFYIAKQEIYCNGEFVLSKCGDYYHPDNLYYTKEEALEALHKNLKKEWEEYKCDEMIKKLLRIRRKIKK